MTERQLPDLICTARYGDKWGDVGLATLDYKDAKKEEGILL